METTFARPKRKTTLPERLRNSDNVAEPEISTHRRPDTTDAAQASEVSPGASPAAAPPVRDAVDIGSSHLDPSHVSSRSELADPALSSPTATSGCSSSCADATARAQVPSPTVEEIEDEDTVPHPPKGKGTKRPIIVESDADLESEVEFIDEGTSNPAKRQKKGRKSVRKHHSDRNADAVDEAGFLKDIDVQPIVEPSAAPKKAAIADINAFFSEPYMKIGASGTLKLHRDCTKCQLKTTIINDTTTLRRHLDATHRAAYHKWTFKENFESKLRSDIEKRKEAAEAEKKRQSTLEAHLRELPPKQRKIIYSERVFRQAVIEWLIATDQPISAVEHPKFQHMIQVAAAATEGAAIPSRKAARAEIMNMFNHEMERLRKRLNDKDKVAGEISLTCDAWQAGSIDGYFAVTAHWIEEARPGEWELQNVIIGFTRLNNAHNGRRLGQALFKIVQRIGIEHKIGHVTCDNAKNNGTMLREFAVHIKASTGKKFNVKKRRVNCLAHVINLATQALISTYSKTPHFDPATPDEHLNIKTGGVHGRDEVGLIRAIAVKERSSAKRKEIFLTIQRDAKVTGPVQLLIDSKTRWSSTYIMLLRAETSRKFINKFIHKIAREEKDLAKAAKIDALKLTEEEWSRVSSFLNLLGRADKAQHAFSSDRTPTLDNAIPALEELRDAWRSRSKSPKYAAFRPALEAALAKLAKYYDLTDNSDAYLVAMYLTPDQKGEYLRSHPSPERQQKFKERMEKIFAERYDIMYPGGVPAMVAVPKPSKSRNSGLLRALSDDEDTTQPRLQPRARATAPENPGKPYLAEFTRYLDTVEHVPEGMSPIRWWGMNASRYPVWASLARDYLAVMPTSVSSERAFSQGGITIRDRRTRLKADVVEALQFLKCAIRQDLILQASVPDSKLELELEADDIGEEYTCDDGDDGVSKSRSSWDLLLDEDDIDLYTDDEAGNVLSEMSD